MVTQDVVSAPAPAAQPPHQLVPGLVQCTVRCVMLQECLFITMEGKLCTLYGKTNDNQGASLFSGELYIQLT